MIGGPSFDPAIGRRVRADRALEREIGRLAAGHGQMIFHEQAPWASITFAGSRHRMTWTFDGPDAVAAGQAMLALLPDHDFAIPGQLVADATILSVERAPDRLSVNLELLLLEESR